MDIRPWHRFYDSGVPTSPRFENVPIPEYLKRSATLYGSSTALIYMNCHMNYRHLKDDANRFATALVDLGVGKDTKVGIQLANIPQAVIAYYAILSLGGQVVMTNPLYVERELEHQWNDAECSVVVVSDYLFESRIRAIRDKLPVKHYIVTSIPDYVRFPLNFILSLKLKRAKTPMIAKVAPDEGIYNMIDLIRSNPPNPPAVEIDIDDVAVLQYTGGTTGVSKGAMLTHRNLSCNVQQISSWFTGVEPGKDVFLACLPYFHVYGMTVCMNFPISVGAAIVLMPDPRDISRLISNIAKHRVTMFPGVPAQFNSINNFPGIENFDLTSVKSCFSASAALPSAVRERFEVVTRGTIVEGFGMTETSPVTHCNPLGGTRKIGSIGVPVPGTDAKVVSLEDGTTELPVGAEGELLIRGPQVMKGYWKQPGETEEAIKDGWLYTGDIATVDEDGYFFIVGRKKEIIIAGGFNIYPDEVDDVLMAHPAVLESGTIGIPDEKRGETVKSFVVLASGRSVTEEALIEYSRKELAAYKVPRQIEFRDSLPKSAALKILRRELRDEELKKNSESDR
ncbi:MAG: long-chain fatty acid--CoA ligase [Armatimonadetes bacterium]|nr:long-chain fatty acid--CoA ligase [Armatimonadota bacterium]